MKRLRKFLFLFSRRTTNTPVVDTFYIITDIGDAIVDHNDNNIVYQ